MSSLAFGERASCIRRPEANRGASRPHCGLPQDHKKGRMGLAYEVVYGDASTVYFTSTRANFAAIDERVKAFEGAMTKALGAAGMRKFFADLDATADGERGELRRRRLDLTASVPASAAAYIQLVGQSRYLRTAIVRVRPGKALDYEAQLKRVKDAQERANPGVPSFVSQAAACQQTGVFYITTLLKSLADLDQIKPLPEVLGSSSYGSYLKTDRKSTRLNSSHLGISYAV